MHKKPAEAPIEEQNRLQTSRIHTTLAHLSTPSEQAQVAATHHGEQTSSSKLIARP
jgi:hypothetical protein